MRKKRGERTVKDGSMFSNLADMTNPKALLRHHAKKRREEIHNKRPDAGIHAAANFMRALAPKPDDIVAVYHPAGTELDTWPLVEALFQEGCRVALPVVIAKNTPLIFREFTLETVLVEGQYKIMTPPENTPELDPNIIVCPLLGFNKQGTRLGMGGGFYDRTLSTLRETKPITAIGYAFADQELPHLKAEAHDENLDWIVTERGAVKF